MEESMAISMKSPTIPHSTQARVRKKVSSLSKNGKIWVMAVDPFSQMNLRPLWESVESLSEKFNATVKVAYVLSPAGLNWTGEFSGPWFKKYGPLAEAKLASVFPDSELEQHVLKCETSGQAAAAECLFKFAKKQKAECLVLSTHGRKGVERITMGSFAETVINVSPLEVLTLNPAHKIPTRIDKILVPTDLAKASEKYVLEMGEFARPLGAEVIIYHKQPDPLDPIIQQGVYSLGGGWVSLQSFFESELQAKSDQLVKLEKKLETKGIKVSHVFDTSPQSLIDSIQHTALQMKADMVSVLTRSGPWRASLLGSVARGLVREMKIPVLVRR